MSNNDFTNPPPLERALEKLEKFLLSPLHRRYVQGLGLRGDEHVLDFGSGSGAYASYLADELDRGRVTCADISPGWMAEAKKRLAGRDKVDFYLGDICEMDVGPDAAFDAVFINFMLHDIPRPERAPVLDKLAELLKPGGVIYLREPTNPDHGMSPAQIREELGAAGFEEVRNEKGNMLPFMMPYFAGIFVKKGT